MDTADKRPHAENVIVVGGIDQIKDRFRWRQGHPDRRLEGELASRTRARLDFIAGPGLTAIPGIDGFPGRPPSLFDSTRIADTIACDPSRHAMPRKWLNIPIHNPRLNDSPPAELPAKKPFWPIFCFRPTNRQTPRKLLALNFNFGLLSGLAGPGEQRRRSADNPGTAPRCP